MGNSLQRRHRILACCLALACTCNWAGATGGLAWRDPIEVAQGRGERGPWRQNESRYDYVDDPAVAIDAQGGIAVAYVDEARKDVFFQRFAADGSRQFDAPVNVSRNPASFSWLPRVLLARNDSRKVFVLWQEILFGGGSHGGDIFFARSEDGGHHFSPALNLTMAASGMGKGRINRDIWHNGSLDLALAADGTLYAAWTEYHGGLWLARSADGGASFSRPQRIAGGDGDKPARAPSLAAGAGGMLYLAWTIGDDDGADIHVARSTDGGLHVEQPLLVAPSSAYSDAPRLALDNEGVLHLVYAESSKGPFDRYRIRYTRSTDGARSFDAPRNISQPLPGKAVSAAFPEIAIDGGKAVFVLWESYDAARERPRGLGMAVSRDGGRGFGSPAMVPGSVDPDGGFNGSYQGLLMKKLAVSRAGGIAIANSALVQDRGSRIWIMRADTVKSSAGQSRNGLRQKARR